VRLYEKKKGASAAIALARLPFGLRALHVKKVKN
jgi:hypothetical protein